jgi:hypothetical protein
MNLGGRELLIVLGFLVFLLVNFNFSLLFRTGSYLLFKNRILLLLTPSQRLLLSSLLSTTTFIGTMTLNTLNIGVFNLRNRFNLSLRRVNTNLVSSCIFLFRGSLISFYTLMVLGVLLVLTSLNVVCVILLKVVVYYSLSA